MKHLVYSILFTALLPLSVLADSLPDEPHIIVTGNSELSVVPDILHMSLSISEVGPEVATARNAVEQRSAQLIKALNALGIKNRDISSAQLQITPHYNWNNRAQIYIGTEVSRVIAITLRDIDKYDALLRSIIDADVARINSTELQVSNEDELREKALQGAVSDAREKARLLVSGLPQKVGEMFSISAASPTTTFRQSRFVAAELSSKESFQPGVIKISESVQVVFYLTQ